MRRRRLVLAAAGAIGVGACWVAALATRGLSGVPGLALDADWARLVREHRTGPMVTASTVLADLGAAPGSIVVAAVLVGVLWWRRGPRIAIVLAVAALLDEGMVTAMKFVDQRPGPSGALFEDRGSFPSGHTAFAAVIAVTLVVVLRSSLARAAAVLLVPVMAVSRTVLDAHWLTDTIAGAVCGTGCALLVLAGANPDRMHAAKVG